MLRALLLFAPSLAAAAPCGPPTKAALVDEHHAVVCFATCWSLDLATRTWSPTTKPADPPAAADPPPSSDQVTFTTTLVPCKKCTPLVADVKPQSQARVDFNEDRSLVAVAITYRALHVFDAKTEKRLATISGWKTPMEGVIQRYELTGDRVIVYVSQTPVSSAARIFDAKSGRQIANAADGNELDEEGTRALGADLRVFRQFDSGVRFVQNLRTGKLMQRLDFGSADPPLEAYVGALAIGVKGDGLMVYDASTNKQASYEVPSCK